MQGRERIKAHWRSSLLSLLVVALVAACGGGGSGSDEEEPAVTFAGPISQGYQYGQPSQFTALATARRPKDFQGDGKLYVLVIQPEAVVMSEVYITVTGDDTARVTFNAVPQLAVGTHEGVFKIRLCKDAACNDELKGSPVSLPYKVVITPVSLTVTAGATRFIAQVGATMPLSTGFNVDRGWVPWTITSDVPWVTVTPSSGRSFTNVRASLTTSSLAVGTHTGTLTVKAEEEVKTSSTPSPSRPSEVAEGRATAFSQSMRL